MPITLNPGEQKELNIELSQEVEYPYLIEGRHCRLNIVRVDLPSFVGQVFRIEFYLVDDTNDLIILNTPVEFSATITLPDGSRVVRADLVQGINAGLASIWYATTQVGSHHVDFEGFEYDFSVAPNVTTNIFNPTGVELLWDCRPYVQETLDTYPGMQDGAELRNLNSLLKTMHFDLGSVDFQISRLLTDEPDASRYDLTVSGIIADPDGCIRWHVRLVPNSLYVQGDLKTTDYSTRVRKYTRIWSYPDPDTDTIVSHTPDHYLWSVADRKELGIPIRYSPTEFSDRRTGVWRSLRRVRTRPRPYLIPVEEVAKPGERYEVLVYVSCGLPPTVDGYDHATYQMRRYHLGYLIME